MTPVRLQLKALIARGFEIKKVSAAAREIC